MAAEKKLYLTVYLLLLVLTAATVGLSAIAFGRTAAVLAALLIAGVKASLIAYYFMHLRSEKTLIYSIVWVGIIAVIILALGSFPDLALFVR